MRAIGLLGLIWMAGAGADRPADDVYVHGRVYTAEQRQEATAFAVRDGVIQYVGDEAGADHWRGPRTRQHDLHNRRVIPGLVDAHIHPIDVVDLGECDLGAQARSLEEIVALELCSRECGEPSPPTWRVGLLTSMGGHLRQYAEHPVPHGASRPRCDFQYPPDRDAGR